MSILDAMGCHGGGSCLITIATAAIVVILIMIRLITVVVIVIGISTAAIIMILIMIGPIAVVVVVTVRTCNTYFFIVTLEGQNFLIDLNEFPHCRHSRNEAMMLEMLGDESNNGGVIIAGLALCRLQLLYEICMRVKNVRLGTSNQD